MTGRSAARGPDGARLAGSARAVRSGRSRGSGRTAPAREPDRVRDLRAHARPADRVASDAERHLADRPGAQPRRRGARHPAAVLPRRRGVHRRIHHGHPRRPLRAHLGQGHAVRCLSRLDARPHGGGDRPDHRRRLLRLARDGLRGCRDRRCGTGLADGLLHSCPSGSAGGRVQGGHRHAPGSRRHPVRRPGLRQGRRARRLRAAGAGGLPARRPFGDHRLPAHLVRARAAAPCNRVAVAGVGSHSKRARSAACKARAKRTLSERNTQVSTNGGPAANGKARYQQDKVRVAIVGVGNCASSFVQGVQYYKDADPTESVPGLMHVDVGGYHVGDIEFSAAFDIDADKVGKDLSDAIWSGQNNTIKFSDVPKLDIPVQRGMTHDGLGKYLKEKIRKAPGETADIVQILKDTRTDVVVSYLPVGSEQATKWYVEQVLEAGVGFVNCIPVFIAREEYWGNRFRKAGLPIVGDDIKSQVGATIVHRQLARLFADRGVKMLHTSQLNVGGNMDFFNMLERERLESKKISKTNAVTSIMDDVLPADDVYIGPSDYVPWLTDRKWAHIRVEGQAFGDVPLNLEMKLEVWDSPNSAGIVIDAVRCCKLAMNHGLAGPLTAPSSYLMKSPPVQVPDSQARQDTEEFIKKYGGAPKLPGRDVAKPKKAKA